MVGQRPLKFVLQAAKLIGGRSRRPKFRACGVDGARGRAAVRAVERLARPLALTPSTPPIGRRMARSRQGHAQRTVAADWVLGDEQRAPARSFARETPWAAGLRKLLFVGWDAVLVSTRACGSISPAVVASGQAHRPCQNRSGRGRLCSGKLMQHLLQLQHFRCHRTPVRGRGS